MAFDIAAAFGDIARKPDGRKRIQYIPLRLIDTNPKNSYSTDGIESLAANIQMFGLMEPLIVKTTESGRYMLISGHRRRLALRMNAEAAENYPESMHEPVACIVEDALGKGGDCAVERGGEQVGEHHCQKEADTDHARADAGEQKPAAVAVQKADPTKGKTENCAQNVYDCDNGRHNATPIDF